MKKLLHYFSLFFEFILSEIIAIIIISCITFFYSYTGIATISKGNVTSWCHESKAPVNFCSEGFAFFCNDENGFNNKTAMASGEMNYLVVGSSHTEATQVAQNDNFVSILNEKIESKFYNIGISGQFLSESLSHLHNQISYFAPIDGVILEIPHITELKKQLLKLNSGSIVEDPIPHNSLFWRFLKKYICGFHMLYKCLNNWIKASKIRSNLTNSNLNMYDAEYWSLVDTALHNASDFLNMNNLDFYILIHPNLSIDENGDLEPIADSDNIAEFKKICDRYGITVIDPSDKFINLYETEHKLPTGFINTQVGAGHMNKYGHRLCAEAAAEAIKMKESI